MALVGEERAQSVQVGAVLLFGFLIISLAVYQAQVVPAENRRVEFRHSEQVQDRLGQLRNAILGAATGAGAPVSVPLGTRYPDRTFSVNPPPVSGTLETVPFERPLWLNNTSLSGDAGDLWTDRMDFSTRALAQRANYRELGGAPTNRIEHGLLSTRSRGANVTRAAQPVVSGNRLTLVALNGTLSRSGLGSTTVDPERLSVSTTETTLESDGTPTLFLPSELPAEVWNETLAGQYDDTPDAGADGRYVTNVTDAAGGVLLTLEPATYRLRLAQVGVGHSLDDPRAAYVVVEEGEGGSITDEGSRQIRVAVRDRFTNPVAGRTVNVSLVSGPAGGLPANATTNQAGEATVTYDPEDVNSTQTVEVGFSLDTASGAVSLNDSAPENATVEFDVTDADATGTGIAGAYSLDWQDPSGQPGATSCDASSCVWNVSADTDAEFTLVAGTTPTVQGLDGQYAVNDTTVVDLSDPALLTNATGENATVLQNPQNGTVTVYAVAGSDADTITIDVRNAGTGGGTPTTALTITKTAGGQPPHTYELNASRSSPPSGESLTEYRWDFENDGTVDQTTSRPTVTRQYGPNNTPAEARVVVVSTTGDTDQTTAAYP